MAAVIGPEPARIEAVLASSDAGRRLDVANFNSFDQTVIAGPKDDLAAVKTDFEAAGVRAYIPLNVSAPFHSRYMRDVAASYASVLDGVEFRAPAIPVVANFTAKPYDASAVRDTLGSQIAHGARLGARSIHRAGTACRAAHRRGRPPQTRGGRVRRRSGQSRSRVRRR